jgi:hypothetical protein
VDILLPVLLPKFLNRDSMNKKIKLLVPVLAFLMSCELLLSQESLTPVVNVPVLDNS